ncbi:MAG: DsbA family protein [Nanoarchaeota archaeon]|nr:DsbA family protein [Nanoarchaeota archaeon]
MKGNQLIIAVVVLVLFLGSIVLFNNRTDTPSAMVAADTGLGAKEEMKSEIMTQGNVKGNPDAAVTIVEYSDFECPFCARFYREAYKDIIKEYVEPGLVKIEFRQFPLRQIHGNAQKAAEASLCASEQDRFWGMHDMLFEKGVAGGVATYKKYASELGLDTDMFNECLDSGSMADEVERQLQQGVISGVRGTPGFEIECELVSGAQPFAAFKSVIDAMLGN